MMPREQLYSVERVETANPDLPRFEIRAGGNMTYSEACALAKRLSANPPPLSETSWASPKP